MRYTSPTKKAKIVAHKSQGLSDRHAANLVGVAASTVNTVFHRYGEKEDYDSTKQRTGRPRVFSTSDVRRAVRLLASGKTRNVSHLQRTFFPQFHPQTIRRWISRAGLKAYKRRQKPLLTAEH
ncbi:hypothetical protein BDN72DRAFT_775491, partial [Pluteus cervinus]